MSGAETARAVASAPSTRTSHRPPSDSPVALEVRGLRRGPLLNDVSFKLYPGEVLGVAALEGQGQEELFDCIAGSRRYDEGAIFAHGKELKLRHPADAVAAGIVLVPANRLAALLEQRPIRENIALPTFGGIRNWGPIRMRAEQTRVESAIARLQIDTRAGSELRRLSGGNQQKVVIRAGSPPASTLCCASTRRAASTSAPSARSTPWSGNWRRQDQRCCYSLRNFPRSRWLATGQSSCSAAGWWPRCQSPKPMKPRCCAPRMGSARFPRLPHD